MCITREQWESIAKSDPESKLISIEGLFLTEMFLNILAKFLKDNPRVKELSLNSCTFDTLEPLAGLESLEFLDLSFTPTNNDMLASIASLVNLRVLKLSNTRVTSLRSIPAFCNLCELHLYSLKIDDLSPLASLPYLKKIQLFQSPGHRNVDITPLSGLTNLTEIILDPLNERYLIVPGQLALYQAILERNAELAKELSVMGKIDIYNRYLTRITSCHPIHPTLEDRCLSVLKLFPAQLESKSIPTHLVTKFGSFQLCHLVHAKPNETLADNAKKLKV